MIRYRIRLGGIWAPIGDDGTPEASAAADLLALQLGRIAAPAPVRGPGGLLVQRSAVAGDYEIGFGALRAPDARGLTLAVWQVLRLLGHRQLGPTPEWEVLPSVSINRTIPVWGAVTLPLAFMNGLGDGGNVLPEQRARLDEMRTRNGLLDCLIANTGHTWGLFVGQGLADGHPEWVSSTGNKLHCENPALVETFAAWVEARRRVLGHDWSSVAIADGPGGWGEIPIHPSDCQILLAQACPGPVSVLAYGFASQPPTLPIPGSTLVTWATAYMQPVGTTPEQVYSAWWAAGARTFALREYSHQWAWNHDQPGLDCLARLSWLDLDVSRLALPGLVGYLDDAHCAWASVGRGYWSIMGVQGGEDPLARWAAYPSAAFPSAPAQAATWYALAAQEGVPFDAARADAFVPLTLALLDATPAGTSERARAVDLARALVCWRLWREYFAARTDALGADALHWAARIRHRDLCSWRVLFADSTLATVRASSGCTSAFAPPWPDSDAVPDEAEVRLRLA